MKHRPYLYGMELKNKNNKPFKFGADSVYKPRKKWSNSSFWLDFDSDHERSSRVDIVKLAGYKRAISNFVNIVTGRNDIQVKYNDNDVSYTDGKTVTISGKLSDGESFDTTVGLALHEGSHCLLTDFNWTKSYLSSFYEYNRQQRIKDLLNVIEDRRIDSYIYKSAPGYRGYYEAMYNEYFYANAINIAIKRKMKSDVNWDNYMFHIINIANPNRDENALPGLKKIFDFIDLKNIDRLKTTAAAAMVAEEVYDMVNNLVAQHGQPQDQDQDDDQADSGQSSQTMSGNGTASGSNGNKSKNKNEQEESEGESEDSEDSEFDDQDESDEQDAEGTAGSEGSDGNDSDSKEKEEKQLTPKEQKAKEKAEKEAKKQEEKETKEVAKNLAEAIRQQKKFLSGNIKKSKVSKKQVDQIEAMTSNDVSIETVEATNNRFGGKMNVNVMVVKGITQQILDAGFVNGHYTDNAYYNQENAKAVAEGMRLGVMLGKKLKTRDEERVLKTTRCATGKIDARLISELGFGAENVFSQIVHYNVKPIYMHLTIDASGSMSGDKWRKSLKTAVAIAKACSMVSNIHVTIDIRGEVNSLRNTPLTWVVYDSQRNNMSHILKHFPKLAATSSTPESLCYASIMNNMLKASNGKESYFITFSDGEPSYYTEGGSYGGSNAIQHCKEQITKLRKNNINVLAYYIGHRFESTNRVYTDVFVPMYGNGATNIDTEALNALSRSINTMFERKLN